MPGASAVLLPLLLLVADPEIRIEADQVEPAATARGLEVRLGAALEGWTVVVRRAELVKDQVEAELTAPDGSTQTRSIVLSGTSKEARSRELAAALALIVEQHQPPPPKEEDEDDDEQPEQTEPESTEPPATSSAPATQGWLAVGGRMGLGFSSDPDPDGGVSLRGGTWLLRDILQPVAGVSWTRSTIPGEVIFDGVRGGAGLLAGAPLQEDRWWVGAGALIHFLWVRAEARSDATSLLSSTELAAMVQFRGLRGMVFGLRTGVDLTLPPIIARGADDELTWGAVRWMLGLEIGLQLPP